MFFHRAQQVQQVLCPEYLVCLSPVVKSVNKAGAKNCLSACKSITLSDFGEVTKQTSVLGDYFHLYLGFLLNDSSYSKLF